MGDVEVRLNTLIEVSETIDELKSAHREKTLEVDLKDKERKAILSARDALETQMSRTPKMLGDEMNPKYKALADESEEKTKEMTARYKEYQKLKEEARKLHGLLSEATIRYNELYDAEEKALVNRWRAVSWDGSKQLTDEQVNVFIGLLKTRKYEAFRASKPYTKVTTVNLSCLVKSSSSVHAEADFKSLKHFIKFSIR